MSNSGTGKGAEERAAIQDGQEWVIRMSTREELLVDMMDAREDPLGTEVERQFERSFETV